MLFFVKVWRRDAPARTLRTDGEAARKIVEVFTDAMLDFRHEHYW